MKTRRLPTLTLGFAVFFWLVGAGPIHAQTASEPEPWFLHSLVGMEVGPTGAQFGGGEHDDAYAARFNGRDIVRACVKAHSEYLVIWARDGEFAYYDSKFQPKAPGLAGRDVLRETIEEARPHNLPVIAYCVLQYPSQALRDHPDWRMQDKDGQPIDGRVCFNSPYRDAIKDQLQEMLTYGIAGFHLDMVDQGFGLPYGCWCPRCKELFETKYHHPMPPAVTWDAAWDNMLEFRYDTSARFERELAAFIREVNPAATVDFNYHGNPPFSWEVGQRPVQHAGNGDFVTGETGVWGFSALGVGLNAEFYRAATPGLPVQVAMQRGVRMYHDQTTRPINDIRWELLTLLSHGVFVTMVDKTAYDGWLDPVAYERIGASFKEARAKREHFGHHPLAEVGIYFSSRTRDWIGRDQPLPWMQSFLGAHRALVQAHIPYGVLHDENLSLQALRAFPIVLLPNAVILSSNEIQLLRRYVEEGGQLLITGHTGMADRLGSPIEKSALEEVCGARLVERLPSMDNWMRFPQTRGKASGELERLQGEIPTDWPFLVKGPAAVFQPTTATAYGELMKPHRTLRQRLGKETSDWPMSADAPVGPAILFNQLGRGRVLTLTCSPDYATASEHAIIEDRQLLRQAIRFLHPQPAVAISAPANVEAVVTDDPQARLLRVHLLAYHSTPQSIPTRNRPYVIPGLIEDDPIYEVRLQLDRPLKHARAWSKSTRVQSRGRTVKATVRDIHEILIIRY